MSAKVEVVSKAKVNLKVTTVAGSGGGVSDHGQLTGLLDDDHPQYQRSEATYTSTSPFTITDESLVITAGSAITLPDAATHPSRVVAIGAAASTVTISPAGTDTMFDDPGNSYSLPQGNGIAFVAVQIGAAWGWAVYLRNGPAFDMPKWYGQSLADGQVLKISGGVPAWGTAPSSGVTSVSGTAPISVTGTTTPTVSIAAASTSAAGSMSSADKSKLDGIAAGATANSPDATLLARANHTGTQTLSTISDAGTAASKNVPASGDASSTQVVLGSDTRLTNARVPQWRRLTFSDAAYDLSATPSPAVSGSVVLQQTGTLSAARTVTLPAASACPAGSEVIVNAGAGASATNTVTIQRAGTDTINGATTSVVIGTAWGQRRFVSDGVSAWAHDDGLMRRSQNLADLASASTARTNLGITTVATDVIFDAAGDLAVGTGADASARLAKGSRTQALVVGASTLEWDSNHYNGGGFVTATVSSAIAETIPGGAPFGAVTITNGGSGIAHLHGIYLPKGVTLTYISFVSGATAAGTPTNQWFALCDSSRTVLRVTANDTTAAWNTSSVKTLALTSTFTTTYSGLHYLACCVTATTMPTFRGVNAGTFTGIATQSFNSTTGLTTPVAEGTTFAASTGRLSQALGIVS